MSRPQSIAQHPGHSELLLAQMEQLNSANVNDPKAQIILNLKRQTIRKSLSLHNKGDDYDWDFWAFAICDFEQASKNQPLLISNVRRGIPPSLRGMVWQLLAETKELDLETQYMNLLKKSSPYEKMIQRDLARTFPGHTFFKERDGLGQEGLYNVVRAYSMYDQEVGYCQGLAFIVGPLLLNMPDEEAFSVLVQLMSKHSLRGHFTPDMEGLHMRLFQFEALVAEHLPHVSRHLEQQGVGSTMYASQWFMTLFAYKFPLNLVYRIYDVLLAEGIVSIFKFSIALLKHNQAVILGLDFEHLLDFLKNGLFEKYKDDDRRLVDDAGVLEIPSRRLAQLEKDHKTQSVKEAANARVLEELQRTNTALRKQTRELELEAAKYQQDDIEIKRQLDDSKDNLTALKEEEGTLKSLVVSLKEEIKALPSKVESRSTSEFEGLCEQNASLVQRNSVLEDELSNAELTLIDMKMRYAESENEREELQRRLYEMKKLLGV
ncbi:rab-GTPase-TBC domain-containing protein [Phycomyces blakesleeanus]|uniref:Rab-GTPase-TBC domain-containing protein n=2 Tax=Phycomyces blakesleeanus TaxID=4837 RepID=A0ABR3B3T0_PHYBL